METIKFAQRFILVLLVFCTLLSMASEVLAATETPRDTFAGAVDLLKASAFSKKAQAITQLQGLDDPRSLPILKALFQGNLYIRTLDERLVIAESRGPGFTLQDPSNAIFQFQVANGGILLAEVLLAQKKYDEALQASASARDVLEPLIARFPDNRKYQSALVGNYTDTAWAFLLTQRPNEAIGAASKGLELDPTESPLKINLAHGYLLTNQFEKAKAIYLENKDVKFPDGRGFVQVALKDFKDLREVGATHPDMKRIERLLSGEASPKQLQARRAGGQSKN